MLVYLQRVQEHSSITASAHVTHGAANGLHLFFTAVTKMHAREHLKTVRDVPFVSNLNSR